MNEYAETAKRLWSQYNGISSKVNEKWHELSPDVKTVWLGYATSLADQPFMVDRILKVNDEVWQNASGITADTVGAVKTIAAIKILESLYAALTWK